MRRGNGEGSIFKLSGNRRKPWAVRITIGYTEEGKQQYKYLGYYKGRTEAKNALREYLVNPYDLNTKNIKLIDIFEQWSKNTDLAETTLQSYVSAFNQAKKIHDIGIRDIKAIHLEDVMDMMKPHMKSVFRNCINHLYKYAMKHEIVDKNIAELISVSTKNVEKKEKAPFTIEEINKVKAFHHPWNDITIILLYSGMRINELLEIKNENVNLEERYIKGGKKTDNGIDRIIPIHDEIFDLIKARYDNGHKYLITDEGKPFKYATFRNKYWNRMNDILKMNHTPHDTRHTFVSFADKYHMNKVALKRIIGHTLSDMTDHYTHKDIEELREEINKIKY